MRFQWRQRCVRSAPSPEPLSVKSQKRWSRYWHSCFPQVCTGERKRLRKLWARCKVSRRRPPTTKSYSDQALIDEKTPADSPRILSLFQEANTKAESRREREEQHSLVQPIRPYDVRLKSSPPSSGHQLPAIAETSPQNSPDEEETEVEHRERGSIHPGNRTESVENHTELCLYSCPSETGGISRVNPVEENRCSTSGHNIADAQQQGRDTLSCVRLDETEEQETESQGSHNPSRPREIVVVFSWDTNEKRTIKRRKRPVTTSSMRKNIFQSPRCSASYLSPSSSNVSSSSESSVRRGRRGPSLSSSGGRKERRSSESPSAAYWEEWHRRSWSSDGDNDHADESEAYSCSSVASSETYSPCQRVFSSPFTQEGRKSATDVQRVDKKREEEGHGEIQQTAVAKTEAVVPLRKEEQDIPSPLKKGCPISLQQNNQHENSSAEAPQQLPSTTRTRKLRFGTGDSRQFEEDDCNEEVDCNGEFSSRNIQNGSREVRERPGSSGRDIRQKRSRSTLSSSSLSATTTSSKQNTPETLSPYCVRAADKQQDTTSAHFFGATPRFPTCLRRNITSLFSFPRVAPPAEPHHRHMHSAPLRIQPSRFSDASQNRVLPQLSLPSTDCNKPTRGRAAASRRKTSGASQHSSSAGAAVLEDQLPIKNKTYTAFPCTTCLSESTKSKQKELALLSSPVKVSHPLATAANIDSCEGIDGRKTETNKPRTCPYSRRKGLPLTYDGTRQKLSTFVSRLGVNRKKQVKEEERLGEKGGVLENTRVAEPRSQQPGQQVEFRRFSDPCTLGDLNTLWTSPEHTLKAHNSPNSAAAAAERLRTTSSNISATSVAEQIITGKTRECTSPASSIPSTRKSSLATSLADSLQKTRIGSDSRETFIKTFDSILAPTSLACPCPVDSSSNASCFGTSIFSPSHFQTQERTSPNHAIQKTECDCAKGERRAPCVDDSSRSKIDFSGEQNAEREDKPCTAEVYSGREEASIMNDCQLGGPCPGVEGEERDDIGSVTAKEGMSNVRPEEMVKRSSAHQLKQSEYGETRRLTDAEKTLELILSPKQRTDVIPAIPPPPAIVSAEAAVDSRADRSDLAVLFGDAAGLASSTEDTKEDLSFLCAATEDRSDPGGGAIERSGEELARLPCVSSPTRQLLYSKGSFALQEESPKDAAAPSADAVSACAAVNVVEGITDTPARSPGSCEGGKPPQAHQEKAHAVFPVPSDDVHQEKAGGASGLPAECPSHAERVLSAVGLGFASVVELGATVLRNLLAEDIEEEKPVASPTYTDTGNNTTTSCGVSNLNSTGSYTSASSSPSTTSTLQSGHAPELCERLQHTSEEDTDERDTDMAKELISSAAATSCGTITSPQARFDAATLTTALPRVTTCDGTRTSTETRHDAAVGIGGCIKSTDAATVVARERPPAACSAVGSVTSAVTTPDEDASCDDDITVTPVSLSRFRPAFFCSAATPAPAVFGSSASPVSCSSTTSSDCRNWSATLPSFVPVTSNTFDSGVDLRAVSAPSGKGASKGCQSCRPPYSTGTTHNSAAFQKGKLPAASRRDTLQSALRDTPTASTNPMASRKQITGCPATSLTASSSTPPVALHPASLPKRSSNSEKFNTGVCRSSGNGGSTQRGRRIFCCHRGSTVDKSSRPCEESSVTSSSGGAPSTCSKSRSFSEVVQAGSRFSVAALLRCMRPFTTKWDSGDPCPPPAVHEPCRTDQRTMQGRDMGISAEEDSRKSRTENGVCTETMRRAEAASEQVQAVRAGQRNVDATSAGALTALGEASVTCCSTLKPVPEGAAAEVAAATAKSTPTAAIAELTGVAPAGSNKCDGLVRPSCTASGAKLRRRRPQCTSRRLQASMGGLAVPPTFPLLPHGELSISLPQCGAQSPQQQQLWQHNYHGHQGENRKPEPEASSTSSSTSRKDSEL